MNNHKTLPPSQLLREFNPLPHVITIIVQMKLKAISATYPTSSLFLIV